MSRVQAPQGKEDYHFCQLSLEPLEKCIEISRNTWTSGP